MEQDVSRLRQKKVKTGEKQEQNAGWLDKQDELATDKQRRQVLIPRG